MQSVTASSSPSVAATLTPLPRPTIEHLQDVWFQGRGENTCHRGALRITSHHLIFEHQPSAAAERAPRRHLIPLSLILKATRIPSLRISAPATLPSQRIYPITLFLKTFESSAFAFQSEHDQLAVFDSLKECAILSDLTQLYAFYYQPSSTDTVPQQHACRIYDAKKEFARQGIGSRSKAWRFTDINAQYAFCPTYPALMAVPSRISDTTLSYAAKYRSKSRLPALTYLHWANHASITRSSQPMVGLKNARSIQDEKLIEAIFTSHNFADPESITAKAAADAASGATASASGAPAVATVYGATTTNLIIDARPTTNAMANVAKGAGTENMEYYKGCKKSYLGIENIHVMRESLNKLTDALRESEPIATFGMRVEALGDTAVADSVTDASGSVLRLNPTPVDPAALRKSMWLRHIQSLMEGSMSIVRNVHINSSHVLIHCSDGWDRTSQLAAIAQICLDPYFRTFDGLAVLIEKDWLSFGHKFSDRGGLKGSERYFTVASRPNYGSLNDDEDNGYDTDPDLDKASSGAGGGGFDSHAAANAFWGFTKQLTANFSAATSSAAPGPKKGSNIKETSPVFHQFLDCIWQIMRQFPERFEYDSTYLVELLRVVQECKYGTFLMDCERERQKPHDEEGRVLPALSVRTVSAWSYLLSEKTKQKHRNPRYQPELDDRDPKRKGTDMGVLIADSRDIRYFEQLFRRAPGDMNVALDKEAEERRRARERLERAVRGIDAAVPTTDTPRIVGPTGSVAEDKSADLEKQSAAIAVVGPGDPDPVLDPLASAAAGLSASTQDKGFATSPAPGAVDLPVNGQNDQAQLKYEPRQARTRAQQVAAPVDSVSPTSASPLDSRNGMTNNVSSAADAAANRMKNLLIGGWGRLQEAIAAPGADAPSMSHATAVSGDQPVTPIRPTEDSSPASLNVETLPHQRSLNGDVGKRANLHAPSASSARSANNPWASNTGVRAEMQREHVAMHAPFSGPNRSFSHHGRPGLAANEDQQRWSGPARAKPGADRDQEASQVAADANPGSSTALTSDPLGVL